MYRLAALSLAVLCGVAWVVVPAPAHAAKRGSHKGITTQLDVNLDIDGLPVLIDATVNVTELTSRQDRLVATAAVVGIATLGTVTQPLDISATVDASVAASCGSGPAASLTVVLHELQLGLSGIPITLRDVALTVASPPNTLVGTLTCTLSHLLARPKALRSAVSLVNQVLTSLLDGGVVTLNARVHLNQFSVSGTSLFADATIDGMLTAKDLVIVIPDSPVRLDAAVDARCAENASLNITLNELHVGVAGVLDLTIVNTPLLIESGANAQLRDLICGVTAILQPMDGGLMDVDQLIDLLNQILALLPQ